MDGYGLLAYQDNGIWTAHCENVTCTSASINQIAGNGHSVDITIGQDGKGMIVFGQEYGNADSSTVAHCSDTACSSVVVTGINDLSMSPSITRGRDGVPMISYGTAHFPAELTVVRCDNVDCTQSTTVNAYPTGSDLTLRNAIEIGVDGNPIIFHWTGDPMVTHCSNQFCLPYTRWP